MTQDNYIKSKPKGSIKSDINELDSDYSNEEVNNLREKLIRTQTELKEQRNLMLRELEGMSRDHEQQRYEMTKAFSEREKDFEKQRMEMFHALSEREKEIETQRHDMALEYSSREKNLTRNTDEMRKILSERERVLESRHQEFQARSEEIEKTNYIRQREFEAEFQNKASELRSKEESLERSIEQFESEKIRYNEENKQKLKLNSGKYVNDTISKLESKEKEFRLISYAWSLIGGLVLLAGVFFITYVTYRSLASVVDTINWQTLTYYAVRGTVLAGLIGVISRYSFVLSNNDMNEGLRTADRIHAIKFGQFYIETYGAAAAWDEVKEAFHNWNGEKETHSKDNVSSINYNNSVEDISKIIELIKKIKS